MGELLTEKVLRCVELIPSGQVVSYGDIAAIVGTGPRQVGQVMAHAGSAVPWWRVVSASGRLNPSILAQVRRHWDDEGIALTSSGLGCRIASHRADLAQLADAWRAATDDLPCGDPPMDD